jgi:hypothetical protein
MRRLFLLLPVVVVCLHVQDNFETQVYGSETVEPGNTMVELHSNFTLVPTNHALHETIEITHGFNDWFETGLYIFTSLNQYG